jgi:AcrR family transcriptional regulator
MFQSEHLRSNCSGKGVQMIKKKPVDRRIQRTRQLLLDALLALILEKDFDSITVQDVIDRANVGRSTFYAHFQDKDELLLSGFEHLKMQLEEHLMSDSVTPDSPWELSLAMFQHAQEKRQIHKALAGKQGGNIGLKHIEKYLFTYLHTHLKQMLSKQKKGIPPEILAQYITGSFMSLMAWWLENDSTYSAEEMNEFYRKLVQPSVDMVLHNLSS